MKTFSTMQLHNLNIKGLKQGAIFLILYWIIIWLVPYIIILGLNYAKNPLNILQVIIALLLYPFSFFVLDLGFLTFYYFIFAPLSAIYPLKRLRRQLPELQIRYLIIWTLVALTPPLIIWARIWIKIFPETLFQSIFWF